MLGKPLSCGMITLFYPPMRDLRRQRPLPLLVYAACLVNIFYLLVLSLTPWLLMRQTMRSFVPVASRELP